MLRNTSTGDPFLCRLCFYTELQSTQTSTDVENFPRVVPLQNTLPPWPQTSDRNARLPFKSLPISVAKTTFCQWLHSGFYIVWWGGSNVIKRSWPFLTLEVSNRDDVLKLLVCSQTRHDVIFNVSSASETVGSVTATCSSCLKIFDFKSLDCVKSANCLNLIFIMGILFTSTFDKPSKP